MYPLEHLKRRLRRQTARLSGRIVLVQVGMFLAFSSHAEVKTSSVSPTKKALNAMALGVDEPILIDGHLNEPAWQKAQAGEGFVERNPSPGAKPPVGNKVQVLFDKEAVYVGIEMGLLPGEQPVGRTMSRDTHRIWLDDAITLKFDVHFDQRTTRGFAVNLATAQIDFIALENGRSFRSEFDAVWEAKTSQNDSAWFAEFRIPFTALGLPWSKTDRILGLNVSRDHSIRNATYDWAEMPKGYGPASALHYGHLIGFKDVGGGIPLSIVPYALLRHPLEAKAGADFKIRVGEDFWLELTALTDFAQIDLDDPVVNLGRFPLRLPEKRPFFLSGLEIFNFSSSMLFFSRRIGLDEDDEEIPIWAGVKAHSRMGPLGIGVLDVVTEKDHSAISRARINLGDYGFLGLMGTAQHELKKDATLRYAMGLDGGIRLFKHRLDINADWSYALPEENTETAETSACASLSAPTYCRSAGAFNIKWLEEPFKPRLTLRYVGEEFDPVIGFVTRSGFFSAGSTLLWVSRPQILDLSTFKFHLHGQLLRSEDFSRDLGRLADFSMGATWRNGWSAHASVQYKEDVVESAFDLLDEIEIDAGKYSGKVASVSASKNPRSDLRGTLDYTIGDHYFGGQFQRIGAQTDLHLSQIFKVSANAGLSLVDLPDHESFQTLTLKSVLEVTPSPDLVSYASFLMVDNNVDSSLDQGVFLFRVRWRYLPGSDAFFVYREDIHLSGDETNERSIAIKLNYRFDTVL